MQAHKFTTGGYVAHKIPFGAGKLSAWYGSNGLLLDFAQFDKNGRATGKYTAEATAQARRVFGRVKLIAEGITS